MARTQIVLVVCTVATIASLLIRFVLCDWKRDLIGNQYDNEKGTWVALYQYGHTTPTQSHRVSIAQIIGHS